MGRKKDRVVRYHRVDLSDDEEDLAAELGTKPFDKNNPTKASNYTKCRKCFRCLSILFCMLSLLAGIATIVIYAVMINNGYVSNPFNNQNYSNNSNNNETDTQLTTLLNVNQTITTSTISPFNQTPSINETITENITKSDNNKSSSDLESDKEGELSGNSENSSSQLQNNKDKFLEYWKNSEEPDESLTTYWRLSSSTTTTTTTTPTPENKFINKITHKKKHKKTSNTGKIRSDLADQVLEEAMSSIILNNNTEFITTTVLPETSYEKESWYLKYMGLNSDDNNQTKDIIILVLVVGVTGGFALFAIICVYCQFRRRKRLRKEHFNRLLNDINASEKFTLVTASDDEDEDNSD